MILGLILLAFCVAWSITDYYAAKRGKSFSQWIIAEHKWLGWVIAFLLLVGSGVLVWHWELVK